MDRHRCCRSVVVLTAGLAFLTVALAYAPQKSDAEPVGAVTRRPPELPGSPEAR